MATTTEAVTAAATPESKQSRPWVVRNQVRISVVVPTRNEAGNVEALESKLGEALAGVDYEVVVVDDSNDALTRPALRAAAARNNRWRVIERAPRDQTGLASAVVAGIEAARGVAVCVMDGDLQHPPEIVPQLLRIIETGADLAVASRYMPGGSRAGLDGTVRTLVSRVCTWLAQAAFPEARRTSDPLTGFFCCRRTSIKGLELKPRGFKILLELLVCAPGLRVADVPFVFGSRNAGESKASTRQGILFLGHLASLFAYVPGSARPLKFAMVSLAALGAFALPLYVLMLAGVPAITAWVTATAASAACYLALHQIAPFRDLSRGGEPDGNRLFYGAAGVSVVMSFAVFAILLVPGRHHIFLSAAFGQACGLLLMLVAGQRPVRTRLAGMLRLFPILDIDAAARRLGAQHAFWVTDSNDGSGLQLDLVSGLVTREMVASASRHRQPALFVERKSARPQPRLNIESSSAIVVPRVDEFGDVSEVAVFVRRSRNPFEPRHLDEAIAWTAAQERPAVALGESQGVA
jgi:dolichol-phosphate mannosyltransferase